MGPVANSGGVFRQGEFRRCRSRVSTRIADRNLRARRPRSRSPALPVWSPRLRGDDGWWAGMTILVYQAAPGVIFRGMTCTQLYLKFAFYLPLSAQGGKR